MAIETVRVDWLHDRLFLLRDRSGYPILMAQPDGVNGADLLPLSVIGCAVWDIAAILQKQRQQLTGLQALAESIRQDEAPWRFLKIQLHYRLSGHNLNAEFVQRAIELTESKYCATLATLGEAVEIHSDYQIVDAETPGLAQGKEAGEPEPTMTASPDSPVDPVTPVLRFTQALNAHDVEAMMRLVTEDSVFENTYPPPDGARYSGKAAARAFWQDFFSASRGQRIEIEDIFGLGERCILRWTYHWLDAAGDPAHIRGVDLYRVRGGRISEKLSYVKG